MRKKKYPSIAVTLRITAYPINCFFFLCTHSVCVVQEKKCYSNSTAKIYCILLPLCCKYSVLCDYKCKISGEEWGEYQVENNECNMDKIDVGIKENLKVRLCSYGMNLWCRVTMFITYFFFASSFKCIFFGGDISFKVMRTDTGVNYLFQTFFPMKIIRS